MIYRSPEGKFYGPAEIRRRGYPNFNQEVLPPVLVEDGWAIVHETPQPDFVIHEDDTGTHYNPSEPLLKDGKWVIEWIEVTEDWDNPADKVLPGFGDS